MSESISELSLQLTQSRRETPPAAEEAHLWVETLDTAGGPTTWAPKDLMDRYHAAQRRARFGTD